MAGTRFDYFDGYLRVGFSHACRGDLHMDLALHGDTIAAIPCNGHCETEAPEIRAREDVSIRTCISASQCPFRQFIAWLEAVACGVQECAFQWDAEGPEGELRWFGPWESGRLKVSWVGGEYEVRLNKVQMVRAFYEPFRAFVESDRYDPLDYEELSAGETFALVLEGGDLEALADALAARSRQEARALIESILDLAYEREAGYPRRASLAQFTERAGRRNTDQAGEDKWLPAEWDGWDFARRRRDVLEAVFKGGAGIGSGAKLRALRSPLVEDWLVRQEQKAKVMEQGT